MTSGNIYLMGNRRNRYVKIGFTRNEPQFREKTLQSEEPEIQIICTAPGTMEDEKTLHAAYAHCRLRGEWFKLTNAELLKIAVEYFGVTVIPDGMRCPTELIQ